MKKTIIFLLIVVVVACGIWFLLSGQKSGVVTNQKPVVNNATSTDIVSQWANKNGVIGSFSNSTLAIKTSDGSLLSCLVATTTKVSVISTGMPVVGDVAVVAPDTNYMSVFHGVSLASVSFNPSFFGGSVISVSQNSILLRSASGKEKTVAVSTTSPIIIQKQGTVNDIKQGESAIVSCHTDGKVYTASSVSVFGE